MTSFVIFILFAVSTSWFCIGLYAVTEEGMLLEFMKKPYNKAYDVVERLDNRKRLGFDYNRADYRLNKLLVYLMKPIIGCPTCMSSVWTLILYSYWFDGLDYNVLVAMMCVAFLNEIHFSIYRKL